MSLGKALVFVQRRAQKTQQGEWFGPILEASGGFREEISNSGSDLEEHDVPKPPRSGLLLFEGWVEILGSEDPDVSWVGEWRELTHWEMCRVRCGVPIC